MAKQTTEVMVPKPNKVVNLSVAPMGMLGKLTLPERDDAAMRGLCKASKELGFVQVVPGLTPLEWEVLLYDVKLVSPREDNLRHFVRVVKQHLKATCTFDCRGKQLSEEGWVKAMIKPVREHRGQ